MHQRMTPRDFNYLFNRFKVEAFRLETLPVYRVAEEQEWFDRFLDGTIPPLPEIPFFAEWNRSIQAAVAEGRRITRVRILDEPPTDYQRFELWAGRWNAEAGETLLYLTRSHAHHIKLPIDRDWWLFDSARLALMNFDPDGRPLGGEIATDPALIQQHRAWRHLAVHHATPCGEWLPASQERT